MGDRKGSELTKDEHIEDQDNEPDDSAAGSVLPGVVEGRGGQRLLRDGGREGEGGQAELEEHGQSSLEHFGECGSATSVRSSDESGFWSSVDDCRVEEMEDVEKKKCEEGGVGWRRGR